jgi:VWFA-related protein
MSNKPSTVFLYFLLTTLVLSALAVPGVTQNPGAPAERPRKVFPKEEDPEDVLRIDTDLVSVDVTAMDAEGRPIKNLKQEDFKVYSDGVEQSVSFFQLEKREGDPRPLAIVFALDVSGSMTADEMSRVRSALQLFSGQLASHPVVYSVMTFGMRVKTVQKVTNNPTKLDEAIERLVRDAPNGLSTHTYDAVDDAVRLLVKCTSNPEKRLMKRAVLGDRRISGW